MPRALPIVCLLMSCRAAPSSAPPEPAATTPAPATRDPAPTDTAAPTDAPPAEPALVGRLDKNDIREVVRAHLGEVRACYNRGLTSDPELSGRVIVDLTIGPRGDVTAVATQSYMTTPAGAPVSQCIASTIRGWTFPAPEGGGSVVVSYPFVFTSSDPVASLTGLVRGGRQPGQWFPISGYGPNALVVEVLTAGGKSSAAGVPLTLVVHTRDGDENRGGITDGRGLVVFTDLPGTGTATIEFVPGADGKRHPSEPVFLGRGAMGTLMVQSAPRTP